MTKEKIRVMIVDDHELVRQGLSFMLEEEEDMEIVGSFEGAKQVLANHLEVNADIILMDIKMPKMNGFELASVLKTQNPEYKVILLSMDINHTFIARAVSEGLDGYLPKNSNIDVVTEAIRSVYNGQPYFDRKIKDYIFHMTIYKKYENDDKRLKLLSDREIKVLRLIADGKQNGEIAEILFISKKTVETHRYNILKKLDIQTTADLVKFAIARGITTNPYLSDI